MRFITADYVFPISAPPVPNGIIVVGDKGIVEEVIDPSKATPAVPASPMETFNGIICPGFINAHCHLELSHLKGKLSEGKGLPQFIREIVPERNAPLEFVQQAIAEAENEMIAGGIVAVGDICNTDHTFAQKANGRMRYHNFIELFDTDSKRAESEFEKGKLLAQQCVKQNFSYSLVPHAPYSVTTSLLKLIKQYAEKRNSILCIHNEETASENEMFRSGTGLLLDTLRSINAIYAKWKATGKTSISYILENLPEENKLLLVHNTYITKDNLEQLNAQFAIRNSRFFHWCFCPNANLFIEKRLPDIQLFMNKISDVLIGTDSYASNWSLSVLDELKTIQFNFPVTGLPTLLQWATLNGAEFFGWDEDLGSIEKGKRPGLNLIERADLSKMQLTKDSTVRKIL